MLASSSFDRKLTAILMLTSVGALAVACGGFIVYDVFSFRRQLVAETATVAGVVGAAAADPIVFEDPGGATMALEALAARSDIVGGWVFDRQGRVLAAYGAVAGPVPRLPGRAGVAREEVTFDRILVYHPVVVEGDLVGAVQLAATLDRLWLRVGRYLLLSGVLMTVATAFAFLLASRLRRWISRPIVELAGVARLVSEEKDFSVRAVKRGEDELGLLVDAFNTMLEQLREWEEKLLHDAVHDPLTGLPNRLLFLERLGQALRRRERERFAVLYLDVDRFKTINDSLGHSVGDLLLIELGRRLEATLRSADVVARLGGDEFGVVLDDVAGTEPVVRAVERLLAELRRPFDLDGQTAHTTASVGIVMGAKRYETPEEVLRDADIAMYRAKHREPGTYALFDERMHAAAVDLLRLENELRTAVDRDELVLHFQPIVSLREGRVVGLEALIRWRHPERGLLRPGEFLHVAHDAGMVAMIGGWVLNAAANALVGLGERFPDRDLFLNVNLFASHLARPDLVDLVEEVTSSRTLTPARLRLEVTEDALAGSPAQSARVLESLREVGVGLAIDDFGTGYSSLSRLQGFPIDMLKIDRRFVAGLPFRRGDVEIVRSILDLAHNLGLASVAEGVETPEQLSRLREMDCGYAQGFLIARPAPLEEITGMIATDPRW